MIIINFKAYKEATNWKARSLSRKCQKASEESEARIISAPQTQDLRICEGEIFAQHVDGVENGSHTGSVLAEGLKDSGASGTILNHSEDRMKEEEIEKSIQRCKDLGLTTVVCAQTPEECGELSKLEPDYVAFEPPELIGGDTSVSEAKPDLIEDAVNQSEVELLTGAGIKSKKDVEKSIELGCEGILVASGVVKAEEPYEKIMELCKGL